MGNEINKANDLFGFCRYNFLEKLLQIAINEEDQIYHKRKEIGVSAKGIFSNERCSKSIYFLKRTCDSCGVFC